MQNFLTDKQTLDDLNLLGKYKSGSMFNLFNRVKTRGAELLLEDMFRNPLRDSESINLRSEKIRYIDSLSINFSCDRDQVEMASQYINESRPATVLSSFLNCYKQKTQEVIYRSDAFQMQMISLSAVQETLAAASQLLGQLQSRQGHGNPLSALQDKMEKILRADEIGRIKARYPYTVSQSAYLQYLFRNKYRRELEELLYILYEFDVYISVADASRTNGFTYAKALEESDRPILRSTNLRHPSLSNATGNDIDLSTDQHLMFLTGANMAGKSTWMKTIGISFYLAHMGFPVAADSFQFSAMDGILTSINVPDDINQGWSHFYAEVRRVKQVAESVSGGKRILVLFDELFKGTNVKDAYDATLAVTERLAKYRTCKFVISTHIIEVGEALKEYPSIQFKYMPTIMEGAVPRYTYQLQEGITTDRQGMIIIENEGILQMLS